MELARFRVWRGHTLLSFCNGAIDEGFLVNGTVIPLLRLCLE